jgi:hypothetical protein
MRIGRTALDGLTAGQFHAEARLAYADMRALDAMGELESICRSYGIAVPDLTNA